MPSVKDSEKFSGDPLLGKPAGRHVHQEYELLYRLHRFSVRFLAFISSGGEVVSCPFSGDHPVRIDARAWPELPGLDRFD